MLHRILLCFVGIFCFFYVRCQEKSKLFYPVLNQDNLEYQALKPTFFLVCQEYLIISKDGTPKYRFGKTYFGRTFAVGILSMDSRIWFPKYVRYPWMNDPNFKEYKETHTPKITGLRYRLIEDTLYRENINVGESPKDTTVSEMFFVSEDSCGVKFSEDFVNNGTLFIFYSSNPAPENRGDIKHLITLVDGLKWTSDGICYLKDNYIEEQRILGGALFQRIITPGNIEWRLAGFYTQINGVWIIKSIKMFK
jgi:hypothetical protein